MSELRFGEALRHLYPDISKAREQIRVINEVVLFAFGFEYTESKLFREDRRPPWPEIRAYCYLLCRDLFHASYVRIGILYQRNHASVIHGIDSLEEKIKHDVDRETMYQKMKDEINKRIEGGTR